MFTDAERAAIRLIDAALDSPDRQKLQELKRYLDCYSTVIEDRLNPKPKRTETRRPRI